MTGHKQYGGVRFLAGDKRQAALLVERVKWPVQVQSFSIVLGQKYRRGFHILNLAAVVDKVMPPNLNRIAMFEGQSTDPVTVYPGAIGTPEIFNIKIEVIFEVFVGLAADPGMLAANGRVVQLNVILRIASNADHILIQFVGTECYSFMF